MSQRVVEIEEEFDVDISLKVIIKSLSNHDGLTKSQVKDSINEFKGKIQKEIESKLSNDYQLEEFLYSSDFVNYEIKSK